MDRLPLNKISEEDFDRLTFESNIAVLAFFGTRRCQVCLEQLPVVEQIAYEYRDKLKAYWVDVDKYKSLFYRFRLQGIPNILIFNEGEVKDRIRGLNSKEILVALINKALPDILL